MTEAVDRSLIMAKDDFVGRLDQVRAGMGRAKEQEANYARERDVLLSEVEHLRRQVDSIQRMENRNRHLQAENYRLTRELADVSRFLPLTGGCCLASSVR